MKIGIHQQLEQSLSQELQLHLSPRTLQMLKILNLTYAELVDRITEEAEQNVLLEVERKDTLLEYVRYLTEKRPVSAESNVRELEELQIQAPKISLLDHLKQQLGLEELPRKQAAIGETLVDAIDERGYLNNYAELKADICQRLDVSPPTVDKVLKIVQSFDPDGVGARSLKECLLLQLEEHQFDSDRLRDVIRQAIKEHLEDLGAQQFDRIAGSLGIPREGVEQIAQFVRQNLNPAPGTIFGQAGTPVIPSFETLEEDGRYKIINLEKRYGPLLQLSPSYLRMLEDQTTDEQTKQFLRQKLESAKTLMEDVARRYETLDKIVNIIGDTQHLFFQRGPRWLNPLLQKEIAETVGVHPSTISRGVCQKFLQSPHGIFPLKFLCPRRSKGASPPRIQGLIQELISQESTTSALSDEEIVTLLNREGITIKRRTVAAYRKNLNIPSSFER